MTRAGISGAAILATMIAGGYVNAKQEAALVGKSESWISRIRAAEPTHPANGPHAIPAGRDRVLAPREETLRWWEGWKPRPPGQPRRNPLPPEGMTVYQWRALQTLDGGGSVTGRMGAILRGRGLLDEDGQLTEQARTLLANQTSETT